MQKTLHHSDVIRATKLFLHHFSWRKRPVRVIFTIYLQNVKNTCKITKITLVYLAGRGLIPRDEVNANGRVDVNAIGRERALVCQRCIIEEYHLLILGNPGPLSKYRLQLKDCSGWGQVCLQKRNIHF